MKCKGCIYFIDLSPDAGACSKPNGGRIDTWGDEDACEDFDPFFCEGDPMNPLADLWSFVGSKVWYFTLEEAQKAYEEYRKQQPD